MVVLKVLGFVAGAALVLFTLRSAIRVFLVPRALQAYLARAVFVMVRWVFWLRANPRREYRRRDAVMAFYAPVSLLTLFALWLVMVLAGYTAMYWGLGDEPLRRSFRESGSALFTLGFERPADLPTEVLMFTEAAVGLGFLALLISYLPSLYGAFSRRETGVAKLEVRAGRPPSGVYLIQLAWRVGRLESLKGLWKDWEEWFVSVDESHSSFPALTFFRSTHADESWVTAAGAILDGASLYASSVDAPRTPEAEFMIRAGYLCLRHIAQFFWIPVPDDPAPTDPISIARDEYDAAYDRLAQAGVAMKPDRDQAWRDFAGWRVNYDAALIGLARLTMAPPAPWSSDRYADGHYLPSAFPWMARRQRAASPDREASWTGPPTPDPRRRLAGSSRPKGPTMTTATFETSKGAFTVRLMPEHAPKTVANFVDLATGAREWTDPRDRMPKTEPLYPGTVFHRVIPSFMIQGGDPAGTGTGGPGYRFEDECPPGGPAFDRPGLLAMANAGPNTNGSQFFVTVVPTPWLTGKHTIFGEVVEGYDVVESISGVATGAKDRPTTDVVLERVRISED